MLLKGNCLDQLKTLPDCSVDSIVSDPPYELGFMGKGWDASGIAYSTDLWREALRVLKPGGHLFAFGGTRTYHRLAVAIEDAGFEIRDSIHWTYGSGFPKSLDISKAIDKAAGHWRGRAGAIISDNGSMSTPNYERTPKGAPATPEAQQWQGWGTALKPSHEPIVVARKPLEGTVAANTLKWGTGGLNIDGSRVGDGQGRWPANTIITHTPDCGDICAEGCPVLELDGQSGPRGALAKASGPTLTGESTSNSRGKFNGVADSPYYDDKGGASRFFTQTTYTEADWPVFLYYAKASKRERNAGLGEIQDREVHRFGAGIGEGKDPNAPSVDKNFHPTVKPVELMRHLIRLVTPKGGTVLDPFLGSGTTAVAAVLEGMEWVGCELTEDYWPIIEGRVEWATNQAQSLF